MSDEIKQARRVMRDAFDQDEEFKQVYIAYIACILMDGIAGLDKQPKLRDDVAEKILDRMVCQ